MEHEQKQKEIKKEQEKQKIGRKNISTFEREKVPGIKVLNLNFQPYLFLSCHSLLVFYCKLKRV